MKYCPSCHASYDDSQNFCFTDGSLLHSANEPDAPDDQETVVYAADIAKNAGLHNSPIANSQPRQITKVEPQQSPSPKSTNTLLAVLLTVLIMLVFAVGCIILWLNLNGGGKTLVVQNVPPNSSSSPSPTASIRPMPASVANTNSTPLTLHTPEVPVVDPEQVKTEISNAINSWKSHLESRDINAQMSQYSDVLDYFYTRGTTSLSVVRKVKQKAFDSFDNLRVSIDNLQIIPDSNGEKSVAVFDKSWNFSGYAKSFSGKVQSQLLFKKINGQWRIAGEKDLKTYYVIK